MRHFLALFISVEFASSTVRIVGAYGAAREDDRDSGFCTVIDSRTRTCAALSPAWQEPAQGGRSMRSNLFVVDVVDGNPVITSGFPTVKGQDDQWQVPLGECMNCGVDQVLKFSATNPPEVVPDDDTPNRGRVYVASVTNNGRKKLQKPDPAASALKAVVMLAHHDELTCISGDRIYTVVAEGTGVVLELYRGQQLQFRSPDYSDLFGLSFDGQSLRCERLAMSGQPEGPAAAVTVA